MTKKKIVIVDDELLFRRGLSMLLGQEQDLEVSHEFENGQQLVDAVGDASFLSDVILLDMSMPVLDGIDTVRALNALDSQLKVVILTSHYNDGIILRLLDDGVSGFLAKTADPSDVIHTVRQVAEKGFHINDYILQLIRNRRLMSKRKASAETLSAREIEVLTLLCEELTTREIAKKLYISPRTIEGHRNRIMEKIDCKNIAGMVVYAIEHNHYQVNISRYQ